MKKMLFFVNPNAGNSGIRAYLLEVLQLFCNGGYEVRVHTTTGPKEITRMIAEEGGNYDMIVVSGGDGTLNEAVSGLMLLEQPPTLGYIPAGTVNDMASSLHLPMHPVEAARIIVNGEDMPLDTATLNGRPYVYVAAFGAFTDVSYATPQDMKKVFGKIAYLLEGVKALTGIKPIHAKVTADGFEEEGDYLFGMMCSTTSVGGFRSKALQKKLDISLNDGLSEVIFVKNIKSIWDLNEAAAQAIQMNFTDSKHFLYLHTDNLRIEFDREVAWTMDGENGGQHQTVELLNHHRAIRIRVPRTAESPAAEPAAPQTE